jgi:transcriptional regulator of acetoin/glycerol metabolism
MSHRAPGTYATPGLHPAPRMRDAILGSWHRCRRAGLDTETRPDATLLTQGELSLRQEAAGSMLHSARPLLQSLYAQVAAASQVAVVCDADGMILASMGEAAFLKDAERLALRPGACWTEGARGTNAIGTGIATGEAVRVHGDEHFIRRHHRLSCSAAPFHYADGSLAGLIDVSGPPDRAPDDLLQRVCETSAIIEQQLFLAAWPGASVVALHADAARLSMSDAQLLAIDRDGAIVGVSRLGAMQSPAAAQALAQWRQDGLGRLVDSLQRGRAPQRLADARMHAQLLRPAAERAVGRAGASNPAGARSASAVSANPASAANAEQANWPVPHESRQIEWSHKNARNPARVADARELAYPTDAADASGSAVSTVSTRYLPAPTTDTSAVSRQSPSPSPLPGLATRLLDTARRLLAADIPVLLQGETGTGKEVLAHWLHNQGALAARPFVAINCAAIPESLIEAELFGYEEGAFTGARRKGMPGRLVEADGGILFLDEIGDMPLAMQTRLLRVLQDRMVHPLGGGRPRQANFRLICATHRDLPALVAAGSFREDLFYRINHYPLTLPPLRARPGLADIIDAVAERHHATERGIVLSPSLRQAFLRYEWPGNLRQLDNLVATLLALCDEGGTIELEDLPAALFEAMQLRTSTLPDAANDTINNESHAESTSTPRNDGKPSCADLIREHGSASAAARAMGLSRSTFYRRLRLQRAEH